MASERTMRGPVDQAAASRQGQRLHGSTQAGVQQAAEEGYNPVAGPRPAQSADSAAMGHVKRVVDLLRAGSANGQKEAAELIEKAVAEYYGNKSEGTEAFVTNPAR